MTNQQTERILECRAVLKRVIAEMEHAVGVDAALPVTMPTLEAIQATVDLEACHPAREEAA